MRLPDRADVEDNEDPTDPNGGGSGTSGTNGTSGTGSGTNQNRQYTISVTSADTAEGTVSGGGTYSEGSRVNISATAKSGYAFDKWNDGNTSASRTVNVSKNESFVAQFKEATQGGGTGDDEDDNPAFL